MNIQSNYQIKTDEKELTEMSMLCWIFRIGQGMSGEGIFSQL
jgi:hypothetical protein